MKSLLLALSVLLFPTLVFSGGPLEINNSLADMPAEIKKPGLNQKVQPYLGIGLFSKHDEETGAKIRMPNSWDFVIGMRKAYNITPFNAFGFDFGYRYQKYCIKGEDASPDEQNPLSSFWDSDRQALGINSLGLEIYKRLGLLKPGGKEIYLDGGIRGDWNFANRLNVNYSYNTPEFPSGKMKQIYSKLDYIKRTSLTLTGRIGIKKIIIYGNYRLSDMIPDAYTTPELPRLTVGLQKTF